MTHLTLASSELQLANAALADWKDHVYAGSTAIYQAFPDVLPFVFLKITLEQSKTWEIFCRHVTGPDLKTLFKVYNQ